MSLFTILRTIFDGPYIKIMRINKLHNDHPEQVIIAQTGRVNFGRQHKMECRCSFPYPRVTGTEHVKQMSF